MSTWEHIPIRCLKCGAPQQIPVLRGIHITRLPWVRAQITDGTFQQYPCPSCSFVNCVEVSTILTDFERGDYIAVEGPFPDEWQEAKRQHQKAFDESFTFGPPPAQELSARLRHRLVFGHRALREKLILQDAGLDDRAVEAVKGDLLRREGKDPWAEQLRISAVLDGGHLLFARFQPHPTRPGDPAVTPNPRLLGHITALHDDYERRWLDAPGLREDYPWLVDEWVVDLWVTCPTRPPLARETAEERSRSLIPGAT